MVDITPIAALIITAVALVVGFVQFVQQYAATGSDYGRYSVRTMGGWAKTRYRKFIWSEVRFEVRFSTPRITIDPESFTPQHNGHDHAIVADIDPRKIAATYCLKDGSAAPKWYSMDEKKKPWFLRTKGSVDEARCPWLDFLEDIANTNLKIALAEQPSSADFMPDGLRRPVAAVDGGSFLTIMSLFGIKWKNKGTDGKFTGVLASGLGEISSTNILNFGDVHQYSRRSPLFGWSRKPCAEFKRMRFIIPSQQAKLAMFNCFDLGFATIRTHDLKELGSSLRTLSMSEEKIRLFLDYFHYDNGWVPGVRDAVACWAAASMPKVVTLPNTGQGEEEKFKSVFSARFAVPLSSEPNVADMLLGREHTGRYESRCEKVESIKMLTSWADDYLAVHPSDTVAAVKEGLLWLALNPAVGNVMLDKRHRHVPFDLSKKCMQGILGLDKHLDAKLLPQDRERVRRIKLKFCLEQIQSQWNNDHDYKTASQEEFQNTDQWHPVSDKVASRCYTALAPKIAEFEFFGVANHEPSAEREKRAQRMVVNRLMRAALWAVHNGNAPSPWERSLQCSLSSDMLQQKFTLNLA